MLFFSMLICFCQNAVQGKSSFMKNLSQKHVHDQSKNNYKFNAWHYLVNNISMMYNYCKL